MMLAFFESDGMTRRREGVCHPLTKEELRGRMALLQSVYPHVRMPRLFFKELNNFFVASVGGWRTLHLTSIATTDRTKNEDARIGEIDR